MVEPFVLDAGSDLEDFRPGFVTGAYLGTRHVNLLDAVMGLPLTS